MELIIIRHGETAWTLTGQHTGTTELELTEQGRTEAAAAAVLVTALLDGREPLVISSPRQRALDTARLALPDATVLESPLIAEFDYGTYEGLTSEQIIDERPGWDIWSDGCPGGETPAQAGVRAQAFLDEFVLGAPRPVVAVTHGHFSRVLAVVALGLGPSEGGLLASSTASVSMLTERLGKTCLGLWNATAPM
jgi:broad specificity phosphatase PhoE